MEIQNKDQIVPDQEKKVLHEGIMDEGISELKLVAQTLNSEITAIKRRWEQAEQENAEYNLKEREDEQKQRELEETNISLQRDLAHLTEKLKHYQKNEDDYDDGKKATVIVDSLSGIEIKYLENKLRLKTREVQVLSDSREKLESRLNVVSEERKRQYQIIMQLVGVKANFVEEFEHQQKDIQGYDEIIDDNTKKFIAIKLSSSQKEREALQTELATMMDELEVRKVEVSVLKQNFEAERKDRERMASEMSDLRDILEQEKQKLKDKMDSMEKHEIQHIQPVRLRHGSGSYGSIDIVRVNGMLCIKKSLHDILLGLGGTESVSKDQQDPIADKFYNECELLWKMRHPNIVLFLGIHFEAQNKKRLSLIMEYLPTNLEKCVEKCNELKCVIPSSIKLSILRDITHGMSHLHSNDIIHHDLSVANVLLTSCLTAKICDFGVSRIISKSLKTLTIAPGAPYIMPPEAMEENPKYTSKLDVFFFGVLALYVMLQKCPLPKDSSLTPAHVTKKQIAIGKRAVYINELKAVDRSVARVVENCLMDGEKARPHSAQLIDHVEDCLKPLKENLFTDTISFLQSFGKEIFTFY